MYKYLQNLRSLFHLWAAFAVLNAHYSDEALDNLRSSFYLGEVDLLVRRRDHFQEVAIAAQLRGDDKNYRVYTGLSWLYAIAIDERGLS